MAKIKFMEEKEAIDALKKKYKLKKSNIKVNDEGHVNYLDFSEKGVTKIEGLEKLSQLQELNLSNNQITKIQGLEKLSQLQKLNLGNNQIMKIEGLELLPQLQTLFLNSNYIKKVEGLEQLSQLKELYLSLNRIPRMSINIEDAQAVVKYCKETLQRKLM